MLFKYHLFLDRRQIMSLLFGIFSGWMTVELLRRDKLWWIAFGFFTLLLTAMTLGLPCLYLMTPKGLHIIHTFGLIRRFIPWDSVVGLEIKYDHTGTRHIPYLFDTFCVYGDVEGPTFFFTEDEMVRTLRARILLEKYTGMKVEGFMIDDLRTWRKKRKEKKERMRRHRERMARVERNRKAREAAKAAKKQAKGTTPKKGR